MTDYNYPPNGGESKLAGAVRRMPRWKLGLIVGSLALGAVGATAQVISSQTRKPQTVTVTTPAPHPSAGTGTAPPGSSGFMGGGSGDGNPALPQTTTTVTTTPPPTITDQAAPYLTKFGFSFFVGLVLGFLSRTFVKFAAAIAVLVGAAAFALSYFHVVNIDMTAVHEQTASATSWVQEQGGRLKDLIFAHLPSAGAATAGFLFGLKRR